MTRGTYSIVLHRTVTDLNCPLQIGTVNYNQQMLDVSVGAWHEVMSNTVYIDDRIAIIDEIDSVKQKDVNPRRWRI